MSDKVIINRLNRKARLEYPCRWLYKVIGHDLVEIQHAIKEVIVEQSCTITPSNSSSGGKYHCFNVELIVRNEEARNKIYQDLKAHQAIKKVL